MCVCFGWFDVFFFKQKTAYEMRISDWSSDVCSSDLSQHGRRHFCADCGTGLFYTNEQAFPGQIDVQTATLDDPDLIPAQVQIQTAERIGWMEKLDQMPSFERYPG